MKVFKRVLAAGLLAPTLALAQSYPSPTYQNLTVLGTLNASFSLANLPAQAANTVVANATSSSHTPTAFSLPSCSTTNSALQYTSGTGFSCYTNSASLTGATFTGGLTASYSSATLTLNDTSGSGNTSFFYQKSGSNLWNLSASSSSSVFGINRYVGGAFADTPIVISNSTGSVTMSDGITGSPISGSTGSFTTLSTSGTATLNGLSTGGASIGGGSINGTSVGNTTPSTGSFTTLSATGAITPSQTAGIVGTTTNNNASAGSVGEVVSSTVAIGSPVSLTTGAGSNVTSISLTPGDWDVFGAIDFNVAPSTTISYIAGCASTTSASLNTGNTFVTSAPGGSITNTAGAAIPGIRLSLGATTTVYLVAQASFSTSTLTAYGNITARRRR